MSRLTAEPGAFLRKRRRRHAEIPRERTSISLRSDVLDAAKKVVLAGGAENLSAFVETALEEKLRREKRGALYAAYDEASKDLVFLRDMDSVTKSFSRADKDGLEGSDQGNPSHGNSGQR
ncbi:MAG TPA: type II toxin-antitoxin system CcdA family antitoxin [Gemmatimonadaceae bacterium]